MKSAVFYGKHDIKIEDRPTPTLGAHDVLIRVKACGICGTDVHIFEGDPGAAVVTPPTVLGHEFSGVVEAVGSAVTRCKPGDRVCVDPNEYCGACDFCRDGLAHYCEQMKGYGTTADGAFAELCAVSERQVYILGANTTFEQGAMTEPVACCLHGIDLCEIKPGSRALVIGGGMIGLIMLQLAKIAGAARVALIEPVAKKRAQALALGADLVLDPTSENVAETLAASGFAQIETVIECVGKTSTIEQAIALAGARATVMMFGLTKPDEAAAIRPYDVFRKELTLRASYINPYTQRRALALIDSGRLDVTSMVAGRLPLEGLAEVLASAEKRAEGKFIIVP